MMFTSNGALIFTSFVPIYNILRIYCMNIWPENKGFKPNTSSIGYHITADGQHLGSHINWKQTENIASIITVFTV